MIDAEISTSSSMTTLSSPKFDVYRSEHRARVPDLSRQQHVDEVKDLSGNKDFFDFIIAPTVNFISGDPGNNSRLVDEDKKYLWVISTDRVQLALEYGESGKLTTRNRLSHTNFTGGGEAHAGGELWFKDNTSVYITGGSSRYQPRSKAELDSIVLAFKKSGYSVCSAGWSDESGLMRYFRNQNWEASENE